MDHQDLLNEDVIPDCWKPLAGRTDERESLDAEYVHLFISEPSKERDYWIDRLPRLQRLKYLEVKSRPNQVLFESICRVPNLERLNIFWSNITDLAPILSLRKLTHLNIGSSPKVTSLEPLAKLRSLTALGLTAPKSCSALEPVGEFKGLRGLWLNAREYTTHEYDSLRPLAGLKELVYLSLGGIRSKDRSLDPVSHLSKLRYLYLAPLRNWPAVEYLSLFQALPNLDCEDLRRAATDADFRRANRIR
jgi:Leucine-rich repeat (LRR) protein